MPRRHMTEADGAEENQGPLKGIRVLDASSVVAGPVAAQLLGDFGADVIKIEHPVDGDSMRTHGPAKEGIPLWWKIVSRNKRSIGMYLGDTEVAEMFLQLVSQADVMIENFRPGTLERWGLGFDRLKEANPDLILLRISGFGQDGPYRRRPAFGTLAEAMSTYAHTNGAEDGPPVLPPFALADNIAAFAGVSAVLMGLVARYRNGARGQEIDLSILEPMLLTLGFQAIWYDQLGIVESRRGSRSRNSAPRNVYQTADERWVAIAASTVTTAARLMKLVGGGHFVEEPWFSSGTGRVEHTEELDRWVSHWISQHTLEEVMNECSSAEVAAAPVYDIRGLLADPQVEAMEMIASVDDRDLGVVRMPNVTFRMSATPGSIRSSAPDLGEHTEEVLVGELGLDPDRLENLRQRGVVA